MRYLLDTNVCIAILQGQRGVRKKVVDVGFANCFVSEISIAELYYGAAKSQDKRHLKDVDEIQNLFQIAPILDCLERYGQLKCLLERRGERLDDFDLLIRATALHYNMTLVSHNTRHFTRMPALHLEDWEIH